MWPPRHVKSFLSPEELQRIHLPTHWYLSTVVDNTGKLIEDPMRRSSMAPLRDQTLIDLLTRKVRAHLKRDDLHFREGTFVRYQLGDAYALHGDAAGMTSGRDFTLLVGVLAAARGGATNFPHFDTTVHLQPGNALIWPNYERGKENEQMDHEAMVVENGTKVVMVVENGTKVVINAWFDTSADIK